MKLRELLPPDQRPARILDELTAARILRAAESERQLNEVLVDFWMNHFNVYAKKGEDRFSIVSFERDTIRPHVWGKFEDLLQATAKSPAMLFYLDNARSVADEEHRSAAYPAAMRAKAGANAPRGLNENYARELMELHTLGVDGGYTQKDVTELARILTGWSIGRPRGEGGRAERAGRGRRMMAQGAEEEPGDFVFRDAGPRRRHQDAAGDHASRPAESARASAPSLCWRAIPSTARHIAYQLCQRLVADEPPPALVDRVAQRFLATGGDLRETVRAIVTSPEFFDPQYYRAKIKSPFEYVVSALRAVGGSTDGRAIAKEIAEMGEPLYLCQPPTGYADTADAWVSSGALLARLNFALALAQGRVPGTRADSGILRLAGASPGKGVDAAAHWLIGTDISTETLATISQADRRGRRRLRAVDPGRRASPGQPRISTPIGMTAMFDRRMFLKSSGLSLDRGRAAPQRLRPDGGGEHASRRRLEARPRRDLPARRRGRTERAHPLRREGLLRRASVDRGSAARLGRQSGAESRRLLRPASFPRAAAALLPGPLRGLRARGRLARLDALALRRAGLHGVGHARR